METRSPLSEEPSWRAVSAQRLSRLLLAADDGALESFRRMSPPALPQRSIDQLGSARRVLEGLARELMNPDPAGWEKIMRAEQALSAELFEDEDTPAHPRSGVRAGGPASTPPEAAGFAGPLSSERPPPAQPLQRETVPVTDELRRRALTVDRILSWSVEDYAGVCAELEQNPAASDSIWVRRGIDGGPPVHEAIRVSWQAKMRDPVLRGRFVASLERHRMAQTSLRQER